MIFARANTFLLQLDNEWLQVAIRVTEEDGPCKGNQKLLQILLKHQVVIKPIVRENNNKKICNKHSDVNPVLKVLKKAAKMEIAPFYKKIAEGSLEENTHRS